MILEAFIISTILGAVSGLLSPFVVTRQMSYMGNGLSHAAFAGAALGLWIAWQPEIISFLFTLFAAFTITSFQRAETIRTDTAVGVFFPIAMTAGILFLLASGEYHANAMSYLFGSVFLIEKADYFFAAILILLAVIILFFWESLAYATGQRELAIADGVAVRRGDYLLSLTLAAIVVLGVKIAGVILVSAFLTIPGAIALLYAKRFRTLTIISVLTGTVTAAAGVWLSYSTNLPAGAGIILLQGSLFIIFYFFRKL